MGIHGGWLGGWDVALLPAASSEQSDSPPAHQLHSLIALTHPRARHTTHPMHTHTQGRRPQPCHLCGQKAQADRDPTAAHFPPPTQPPPPTFSFPQAEDVHTTRGKRNMAPIKILFFAAARELAGGVQQVTADVAPAPDGDGVLRLKDVRAHLAKAYPGLRPIIDEVTLALNMEYVSAESEATLAVQAGDEVALIPPISGG